MAEEIRGAQTNTSEQANAPKDSTDQQQAQKIIGEGSATVNTGATPTPVPNDGATSTGASASPAQVQQAADVEPKKADGFVHAGGRRGANHRRCAAQRARQNPRRESRRG